MKNKKQKVDIKKTLYFDIATVAKVQKVQRALRKHKVSESHIVRKAINAFTLDHMVESLKIDMENAQVIDISKE